MKKIISLSLCLFLITSIATVATPQGNVEARNDEIEGLREQMDTLWMKNYFSQEELDTMEQQQRDAYIYGFWAEPQYANRLMAYPDVCI